MRIIKPSFKRRTTTLYVLEDIEDAGRTCYKSEEDINEESSKRFVRKILERGHESVIEHVYASVRIICDRGVSHEIVRHRLASYSQESTRYCNYSKEKFGGHITVIKPCFFSEIPVGEFTSEDELNSVILGVTELGNTSDFISEYGCRITAWVEAMFTAETKYFEMIKNGCSPQEARSVLPNSLKTEIVMTCNVREWRHFFKLRTTKKAHPQMREIAQPMLDVFKECIPVIFDDINYIKEGEKS